MAKIAFIVPPLTGHYNPTLSLGAGLIEKGHEVSWIALDHDNIDKKLPEGSKFIPVPLIIREENKEKHDLVTDTLQGGTVHGIESIKYLYEHAMTPFNIYMYEKIMTALDENPMDLIIVDKHLLAGAVAAVKKGIPYITSVSSPASIQEHSLLPQISQMEVDHVIAFQQQVGIEGDERLDNSKLMCLVYTSQLFFGDYDVPDYYQFIGPVINPKRDNIDFDWEKFNQMPGKTKLLVSVGTTFSPEANRMFFNKVAEALGDGDYTVVAISDKENFDHIPDNFIVQRRVPQLDLLPYMDMVICHGGFNTVSETLLNAKPIVVLPKAYDQSYVSSKIMESNTGIRLNFNRFKPQHLREAVEQIISDGSFAENAGKIKQSLIQAGGIAKGVELIESVLP